MYLAWQPVTGMFSPAEEAAIRAVPAINDATEADAVLRIAFPYNCAQWSKRTLACSGPLNTCGLAKRIYYTEQTPAMR